MDSNRHPAAPRRAVATALARTALNVAVWLVLYSLLPLDRTFGWRTVLTLAGGLVLVAGLVGVQIRAIAGSRYPALRAMEALAATVPLFLLIFAGVYVVLGASDPHAFSEPLSRIDALYFVVTVFATVGFGDITPVSETARLLSTVQMVGDLLVLGLVVRAVVSAVEVGRRGRRDHG